MPELAQVNKALSVEWKQLPQATRNNYPSRGKRPRDGEAEIELLLADEQNWEKNRRRLWANMCKMVY